LLERAGIGLALLAIGPFFIILSGDLFAPAHGDRLRSKRGGAVRALLAIFWTTVLIGAFVAALWLNLGMGLDGWAGFFALVVPPYAAVYTLRFLGPGLTRIAMRLSGA
jgi:hypothetical protein